MRQMVGITGARPTSRARARSPGSGSGGQAPLRVSSGAAAGYGNAARSTSGLSLPASAMPLPTSLPRPGARGSLAQAQADGRKEARSLRNSRLSVVVRKRPMNRGEVENKQHDVVLCRNSAVIVREPKLKVDLTRYVEEHNFLFDQSFDETVTNEGLYQACVRPVIDAVFQRAKCTCFAYGQTGSGKTFTMMGPPKRLVEGVPWEDRTPGIFLLASQDIFRALASKEHAHLSVYIAFYEIYCGKLFDLLNNRQILQARENAKSNVVIVGLKEHPVENVQELMEVIEYGLNSRTTGQTGANVDSSRSHAILQICLKDLRQGDEGRDAEHGKISFIDLAGSERGADTLDTDRQTRMDGAEINKSLLALKECIRALDQQLDHTPFRGSKLTQVLKDSFVGANCRTVMIANVNPCSSAVEHSLNTLRYAYRVKELRSAKVGPGPGFVEPLGQSEAFVVDEESSGEDSGRQTPPGQQRPRTSIPHAAWRLEEVGAVHQPQPQSYLQQSQQYQQQLPLQQMPLQQMPLQQVPLQQVPLQQAPLQQSRQAASSSHAVAHQHMEVSGSDVAEAQIQDFPTLDELARQHDRLIGTILAEEEELISAHRQHIDMMVELIKEEMVHLNNVDRPGSDVDAYVAGLDRILRLKADYTDDIRQRVDLFKEHLQQEDALSRKFQSLASSA